MKYLLGLLLLSVLLNCTENINQPNEGFVNSNLEKLERTLENYNLGDSIVIKIEQNYTLSSTGDVLLVLVVDSAEVKSNGFFSISLSKPDDRLLSYRSGLGAPGLVFSNETTKMFSQVYLYLYKNNKKIGDVFCSNNRAYLKKEGDYFVYIYYSSDTLSVYGNSISTGTKKKTNQIDYHLKKGWNLAIKTIAEITDTTIVYNSIINNDFIGAWGYKISN